MLYSHIPTSQYSLTLTISSILLVILLFFAIIVADWSHVVFIGPLLIIQVLLGYKRLLPKVFFLLFPFIAFFATLGSKHVFDLYEVLFYDKFVHFSVNIILIYFFSFLAGYTDLRLLQKRRWQFVLVLVSFSIAIGTIWEIFEWFYSLIQPFDPDYTLIDTISDLIIDSVGAGIAGIGIYWQLKRKGDSS